ETHRDWRGLLVLLSSLIYGLFLLRPEEKSTHALVRRQTNKTVATASKQMLPMTAESERGADMLMSPPSSIDATAVGADGARGDGLGVPRVELAYEPRYQRFIVKKKSFTQQFSHVYNKRLLALKGAVRQAAEKR
ncbi:unnamed protein product, partial [Ectocarpus sp. 12 AP-2014]